MKNCIPSWKLKYCRALRNEEDEDEEDEETLKPSSVTDVSNFLCLHINIMTYYNKITSVRDIRTWKELAPVDQIIELEDEKIEETGNLED